MTALAFPALETAPPPYLLPPNQDGYTYGTLSYEDANKRYIIRGEPALMEFAKRLFPGSGRKGLSYLAFRPTRRLVGDLTWLMQRYPLRIECDRYWQDLAQAVEHAAVREQNLRLEPIANPPRFKGELMTYQAEAVAFFLANKRALLGDEMGLGKTIVALATLAAADAFPALICVEPHLLAQWESQIMRFLELGDLDPNAQLRLDGKADSRRVVHRIRGLRPYALPKVPIIITHYGILRGWRDELPAHGFKAFVADEIQAFRHGDTEKYSVGSLITDATEYVLGLSGTPIHNYGDEMWSILNIIDFHCLGDRESFTREWCNGYGSKVVREPKALGDYLRREGLMLARTKQQVGQQLPPKRRVVHVVDKDEASYQANIREAITLAQRYDGITDWGERGRTKAKIEEMARRATGVAKAPMVAAFVRGLLEAGERVLLFAHHHDVHEYLTEALRSFAPARMTGLESKAEKEAGKWRFREGETPLIQIALRSAAGIDGLQEKGTVVVFAELDWSPAVHAQCEDRLQRPGVDGALESILCYYLVADTGSDETIQEALGLKVEQYAGIMDRATETQDDKVLAQTAANRMMDRVINALKGGK